MNCNEAKELLSHYYDDELAPDVRERVAAHLSECAPCTRELAGFRDLSGMVRLEATRVPAELGWQRFAERSPDVRTAAADVRVESDESAHARRDTGLRRRRRPVAFAVAALLLIAAGWIVLDNWFVPGGHDLFAADVEDYVEQFRIDPRAAQRALMARYNGRQVDLAEAVALVGYRPAAAGGLPEDCLIESMCMLQMPCCDCLQTVCRRSDGSRFAILEYGDEMPRSAGDRPSGLAPCCGADCCLAQISEKFAASWKQGVRHISVIGIEDQAEIDELRTRLAAR